MERDGGIRGVQPAPRIDADSYGATEQSDLADRNGLLLCCENLTWCGGGVEVKAKKPLLTLRLICLSDFPAS